MNVSPRLAALMMLAAASFATCLQGAVTNTVPWSDSFETYTSGSDLPGTNGWSFQQAGAGMATADVARATLLGDYLTGSRSLPLPASSHTNIMKISAEVVNSISSATGGVMVVDFMAMPTWSESEPGGQTNDQYAFYVATNGLLSVWHRDWSQSPATNVWLTLTNSPVIGTNDWHRFTIIHDYTNGMFQVSVDEGTPLRDAAGWQQGGGVSGGSWFHMVCTNPLLSALVTEASSAYLDDLVAARRSLVYSRSNFVESVTNNGAIDPAPLLITAFHETFLGNIGDDLVAGGTLAVSGLPSNLVAVALLTTPTNVSLTLSNRALLHEAAHSLTNLTLQFADGAFAYGRASDVLGYRLTNVSLTFSNTPALGYSRLAFAESAANNGTVDNTTPLTVTLTNATFAGIVGENIVTNGTKLQMPLLPASLVAQATIINSTQLEVRLTGTAAAHYASNSLSNLRMEFGASAFSMGATPLASVLNLTPDLTLTFLDPSRLTFNNTSFSESITNNGSVSGSATLFLSNRTFNASAGADMATGGLITSPNLPAGLVLHVVRDADPASATLSFSGTASHHEASNSIANLTLTLTDGAVVGANVSEITGYSRSDLAITFSDSRALAYSRKSFVERSAGAIDNRTPAVITLAGDTFTGADGDDFVAAGKITVSALPAGLVAQATRVSATQLSVVLTGTATSHASGDSVSNVHFTFQNSAFAGQYAIFVGTYAVTDISVTFNDLTGIVNLLPFEDSFEPYALGALIGGTNGWTAEYTPTAGIITNPPDLLTSLATVDDTLGRDYPISGTHSQILYVQDFLYNEVHSESEPSVFVDFMVVPVPVEGVADSDTNDQYAVYVSTNGSLVVWHHDPVAVTNLWSELANVPHIGTSDWTRVTIEHRYADQLFCIRLNEGTPLEDPMGWTLTGQRTGSWFHMVQTNGTLNRFKFTGAGTLYIDDFAVRTALPGNYGNPAGSVYLYR